MGGSVDIRMKPRTISRITKNGTERRRLISLKLVKGRCSPSSARVKGQNAATQGTPYRRRNLVVASQATGIRPTSAAGAGLGRPWKKRCSTLRCWC